MRVLFVLFLVEFFFAPVLVPFLAGLSLFAFGAPVSLFRCAPVSLLGWALVSLFGCSPVSLFGCSLFVLGDVFRALEHLPPATDDCILLVVVRLCMLCSLCPMRQLRWW